MFVTQLQLLMNPILLSCNPCNIGTINAQSDAWELIKISAPQVNLPGALDAAAVTEALNLHVIKGRQTKPNQANHS